MNLYSFIIDRKRTAIHIEPRVDYDSAEINKGNLTLKENNEFEITKGTKPFDALSFTYSVNWVFSERVKNIFEENKVTGIEFYLIIINGLEEKYFGYFVTGKAGKITSLDSMGLPDMFKPYQFNKNEWDGSDIFRFENSGGKHFSDKVKNILEENKVTNLEINDHNK